MSKLKILAMISVTAVILPRAVLADRNIWTSIGPEGKIIGSLAIDPQNPKIVYAGAAGAGVYKTTDGGESWTRLTNWNSTITTLLISPENTSVLYASLFGAGLYKSTDGGANWRSLKDKLASNYVTSLAIDPKNNQIVYAGLSVPSQGFLATSSGEVHRSTDGGETWSKVLLVIDSVTTVAIDAQNPNTLYAGLRNEGVYKSPDGGANWSRVNAGLTSHEILILKIDSQRSIYAATFNGGMFKSSDGGTNWRAVNAGLPLKPNVSYLAALAIDPQNSFNLYVGILNLNVETSNGGIYQTTNAGESWSSLNEGLPNLEIHDLKIDPQNPNTLYAAINGGVFTITLAGQPRPRRRP